MTVFGLDVSRYQTINLAALPKQGYVFFAAKCTEGAHTADPTYAGNLAEAKAAGALFAAYHFLHSDSSAAVQADNIARHILDKSVPVMIDCEPSGSSHPTLAIANALRVELAKRGIRATVLYFPKFWYEQQGSPSLKGWAVWQARYPSSAHDYGSRLYLHAGGDSGKGWASEGGQVPVIWQFASSAKVDGVAGSVDVNAFRGTRAQLAATGIFKDFGPVTPAEKPADKPTLKPTRVLAARVLLNSALKYCNKRKWTTRADAITEALHDLPPR